MEEWKSTGLVDRLRGVGLSRYEAYVYLGLVSDQSAKVAEISRRTGVPQPKVYQALESLSEKGFCSLGAGEVNRYRPYPPVEVIGTHVERLRKEALAVTELGRELEELRSLGEGKELWAPPLEVVKGARPVRAAFQEHLERAERTVDLVGKAPRRPAHALGAALQGCVTAGCCLRVCAEPAYFDAPEDEDEVVRLFTALPKEQTRQAEDLPSHLVLIDGREALVSLPPTAPAGPKSPLGPSILFVFRQSALVAHFQASFDQAWKRGRPR